MFKSALDIPHLRVRQQGDQVPAVAHQVESLVPRLSPAPPAGQGAQQQSWVIRVINRVINRVIRVIKYHELGISVTLLHCQRLESHQTSHLGENNT